MASPPQPTLVFAPSVKPNKCIIINYECPPNPNLINHTLEILVNVVQPCVQADTTKAPIIYEYISQIYPLLLLWYDQCVNQMLAHTGTIPPNPQSVYMPVANNRLQEFLDELWMISTPEKLTQQASTQKEEELLSL